MSLIPNYVPNSYKTLNIYLMVKDAQRAIHFYNSAFGAEEVMRLTSPEGAIVHCELKIADTIIMLSENPEVDESAKSRILLQLYTEDVEGMMDSAVDAGAELKAPIEKKFYGDRSGRIQDPFGFEWIIATHMEDLTAAQIYHRFTELHS